jgi:hypothetical protein
MCYAKAKGVEPMRVLILPLMLAALPASAAPPAAPVTSPAPDTCKRPDLHQAETPKRAKSRKLGELPPGDLILSVYNHVGGCMEPVIVRYGDGRAPAPASPEPLRPKARLWR